jgi:hypothetical protein
LPAMAGGAGEQATDVLLIGRRMPRVQHFSATCGASRLATAHDLFVMAFFRSSPLCG